MGVSEFTGPSGVLESAIRGSKLKYIYQEPKPQTSLGFGSRSPFNLYTWEVFFYIPMMVALRYRIAGNYQEARSWLKTVYDPSRLFSGTLGETCNMDSVWRVKPLRYPENPNSTSAIGTANPDLIAREDPYKYRIYVVRAYIETLLDYGDSNYRLETAESLRAAKSNYASVEALFEDKAGEVLEITTMEEWQDPVLGQSVQSMDLDFLCTKSGSFTKRYVNACRIFGIGCLSQENLLTFRLWPLP